MDVSADDYANLVILVELLDLGISVNEWHVLEDEGGNEAVTRLRNTPPHAVAAGVGREWTG